MIKYFNRNTKKYEVEKVAGENYLKWTYNSPIGMTFLEKLIKKNAFSKIYGWYCDKKFSSKKIKNFVETFDTDISEMKKKLTDFQCFNDFFTREITESSRPISENPEMLISPADGRLTAFENISLDKLVQVKGLTYSLSELINNNNKIAEKYKKGTFLIFRLCPTDYHRFHFIDSGTCDETVKIRGFYYSVNPIALNTIDKLFCQNKREWSAFHSDNFGDVLYIEVGATCVGSIIQTYTPNVMLEKGSEKGYFKFGGSTVILFFENNKIQIDEDILKQSALGFETKVQMGETIGRKVEKIAVTTY